MNNATKPLEEIIQELPPNLKIEVKAFVESLLNKSQQRPKRKLRQDWAGKLKAETYTSVDLQHLANDWRSISGSHG
jgi:hypothetical protein